MISDVGSRITNGPGGVLLHSPHTASADISLATTPTHWEPEGANGSSTARYHVYYRKEGKRHFIITPLESPGREHCFRRPAFLRKREFKEKDFDVLKSELPEDDAANSYFIHQPVLSFHHPPRTFRRGASKSSPPVCLITNSFFWRRWTLQFGDRLSDVVDPRGLVDWRHSTPKKERDHHGIKGYKVRKWRFWGETGKAYHREVNAKRKEKLPVEGIWNAPKISSEDLPTSQAHQQLIDEVIHFKWVSPFTNKTRLYQFDYCGISFHWKGTGSVRESRACGFVLRFNHLKLAACVPVEAGKDEEKSSNDSKTNRQICLGKYTSSIASRKAGILELYDEAVHRLVKDFIVARSKTGSNEIGSDIVSVKHTRLYDIIMATAMCMIIGEWQKRKTIRQLIELIATEGAGGATN